MERGLYILELKDVKNIGPKTLERLNAKNIYTINDLLLFFPKKYHFYVVDNSKALTGENVCVKVKIMSKATLIRSTRSSKAFVFYASINNLKIKCIIFGGDYLRYKVQPGIDLIIYGKYKQKENFFSVTNIFFEEFACKIELDYNVKDVANSIINNGVKFCLANNILVNDDLPAEFIQKYRLLGINDTIKLAHFPKTVDDFKQIRRRLRYEEFFWYSCSLEALRMLRDFEAKSPKLLSNIEIDRVVKTLPFELTADQNKVILECLEDLASTKTMNRLIEGDVGSGKSIVAFIVAYANYLAGYQTAIMAPTEILAKQHFNDLCNLFSHLRIALLTSSLKKKEKEEIIYRLMHGRIDIIVGTHSLLYDSIIFKRLGLVIIDEQHRFGVNQRKTLIDKFQAVDALYMTATPIPRTLGLTSFGDLDLSIISQKPKDRKKIITKVLSDDSLDYLAKILMTHISKNEQIYIVVPLVESSDFMGYYDINQTLELFSSLLPNAKMKILHGKMKAIEKSTIMQEFKNQEIDCLISTTVIEVGVNVPTATVMVILDSDRYGLSQIHQLRGRVGRSDKQGYCYLITKRENVERLNILENTDDGFKIAEEDFKLRGPGDYLGEEQSGYSGLNFDLSSIDLKIWQCAKEDSKEYIAKYLNKEVSNKKLTKLLNDISDKKSKIN